jgi:hypothetical protein
MTRWCLDDRTAWRAMIASSANALGGTEQRAPPPPRGTDEEIIGQLSKMSPVDGFCAACFALVGCLPESADSTAHALAVHALALRGTIWTEDAGEDGALPARGGETVSRVALRACTACAAPSRASPLVDSDPAGLFAACERLESLAKPHLRLKHEATDSGCRRLERCLLLFVQGLALDPERAMARPKPFSDPTAREVLEAGRFWGASTLARRGVDRGPGLPVAGGPGLVWALQRECARDRPPAVR